MAAGAIDWMSVEINNYLYTHAIKVFEESRETFFKKFLWSPKAKGGVGVAFFKKHPHKKAAFPQLANANCYLFRARRTK